MSHFKSLQDSHEKAMDSIRSYMEKGDDLSVFVKWLMETDANPYTFLSYDPYTSSESLASLVHEIHHSLYDDGEITFITLGGEPRLVFLNQHDETFEDKARNTVMTMSKVKKPVKVLDCSIADFVGLVEEYHVNYLKRFFQMDAKRFGVEFATKHYKDYKRFDPDWIEEVSKQVDNRRDTGIY